MNEDLQSILKRRRTTSHILLVVDVFGLLLLLYCTTIVTPKFRHIFNELLEGQTLPVLTQCFLSLSRTVSVVLFVGAIGALLYKESRISGEKTKLVINETVCAAIVILFIVFVAAMFMPLTVSTSVLTK